MSKKVLTYSLFGPKVLPQHRTHDKYKNDIERYWFNLPAAVLTNQVIYPDHIMRLYITPNIAEHKFFPVISILEEQPNFSYHLIERPYHSTEPALWRMLPLWERDVDILHTRDIDSIPSETEYRYTMAFESSSCVLGSLRTHANHYGIKCRMLAGLSSFRPPRVPTYMKHTNFDTYYSMRHSSYGSDQDLMIQQFTTSPQYTKQYFYDHCAYNQKNAQDFPCVRATTDELNAVEVSVPKKELFSQLILAGLDNWAGQPIDARGPYTDYLLNLFPEVRTQIKALSKHAGFYKIK